MSKRFLKVMPVINVLIASITILLFLIYAVYYYTVDDIFMMNSSLVIIIVPLLIFIIDKISGHKIPQAIKMVYLLFFFFSAGLGAIANFYNIVPYYDKFVHFVLGILLSWLFILGFERYKKHQKYDLRVCAFSLICFTSAAAVFWEVCEFTFDMVFNKHVQRGNTDTMTDMMVAILGCLIVLCILIWKKRHQRRHS
jgi:hypothetical protein